MVGSSKYSIVVLVVCWGSFCQALMTDELDDQAVLDYADKLLECGVYYQYTARGMSNNPRISTQVVDDVSHNSRVLLGGAQALYNSTGVSAQARYAAVMARARRLVSEKQTSGEGIGELIFDAGKRCQRLVADYPARMGRLLSNIQSRR